MLNKIKNILSAILYVLCMPIVLVFLLLAIIKNWIIDCFRNRTTLSIVEYISGSFRGNTDYKIECPECGYSNKIMIGGGHTSDLNGHFHIELAYCPSCKEPLVKRSISYRNKSDGESNTDNQECPKCGQKTVPYSILQNNVNLKCPKCNYRKLKITDLHSFWMT